MTALLTSILFVFASCNKDAVNDHLDKTTEMEVITTSELVDFVNNLYLIAVEFDGDETRPFHISDDGLIDIYTTTIEAFDVKSNENKLLRCLQSISLNDAQTSQVRRALSAYQLRNERIIQHHRQAVQQLNTRVNNARQELLDQFHNGEINRAELNRRIHLLRDQYHAGLRQIKANHAEAFSHSFTLLLDNINSILTERQWHAFASCMRS